MVDSELGWRWCSTAASTTTANCGRAGGLRLSILLHARHRGGAQGFSPVGCALRRALQGHVRVRNRRAAIPGGDTGARPTRHQAALPRRERRAVCASPRRCRALLDAGDVDTGIDHHALHHYISFHSVVPAPMTILRGVRKLPPATVRIVAADGSVTPTPSTGHRCLERDADRVAWSVTEWQEALLDSLRTAVSRRMVADVPVGVLLSGGIDSSLVVALLAEQGQHGLATFSIGFDAAGGGWATSTAIPIWWLRPSNRPSPHSHR